MVTGLDYVKGDAEICENCIVGKQTRMPFVATGKSRASDLLELIHSDLCGPMEIPSWGNSRYILSFIDDKSRKTFVYFLKRKSEVKEKFKEFKVFVEKQTGKCIKAVRTDNGTEYMHHEIQELFRSSGIQHQRTVQYNPEQNGVAERAFRTILDRARTMLFEAGLDKRFWAEAVLASVYIKNRCPTKSVSGKVPEEVWTGKKIDVSHLRVFGARAFVHVPKQMRTKWDKRSKEMVLVGFCEDSKAYRLVDFRNPYKIKRERNVTFIENFERNVDKTTSIDNGRRDVMLDSIVPLSDETCEGLREDVLVQEEISIDSTDSGDRSEYVPDSSNDSSTEDDVYESISESGTNINSDVIEGEVAEEVVPEPRYPRRERKAKEYPDMQLYNVVHKELEIEPKTVQEALNRTDREMWKVAMTDEIEAFKRNEAWSLEIPPKDKKIITCKWVFQLKKDNEGNIVRHKARLVARGFDQRYGSDYHETFSPVIRHSSLKLLFALAVEKEVC
jgi:hypothetical protein